MVWPWLPIREMRFGETRNLRQAARAASAKSPPKRKFNWLSAPALIGCCSATRRISLRSESGNLTDVWPSSLALRFGGAPEIRARATSIPSADVPDIMPKTSMDRLLGFKSLLSLQNPTFFLIFKIGEPSRDAGQEASYSTSEDSPQCFRKWNFLAIEVVVF